MAKEDKNKKGAESAPVTDITVDNIREQLGKGTIGTMEMSEAVLAEIKKEKDENTQREMKQRYQHARYDVLFGLIKLRRERDIADIEHEELTHRDRLARYLMGFKIDFEDPKFKHAAKYKDIFEKETVDADKKTIDEAPNAYKPMEEIVRYIEPTVNILYFMKPMMNIKASDTKEDED